MTTTQHFNTTPLLGALTGMILVCGLCLGTHPPIQERIER